MEEVERIDGKIILVRGVSKKSDKPYLAIALDTTVDTKILTFDKLTIMRICDLSPNQYDEILYKEE